MPFPPDLAHAVALARATGLEALKHYGSVERLTKTHAATTMEAVTEADRACQRLIIRSLRERYPTDGMIGEESDTGTSITADIQDPAGRTWVIDPIDGTNNFIAGLGNWAVCIGLLEQGVPVLGVVYDVTRDVCFAAAKGAGAWANDKPIVALPTTLGDCSVLMLTSNLLDKTGRCPAWACNWLAQTTWKVRVLGSAAIESVMVAAGVAHGAVTVNGKLWDCVAPAAIALEAGAAITDLEGGPVFPYDVRAYAGAKVPYLTAAPNARDALLDEMRNNP